MDGFAVNTKDLRQVLDGLSKLRRELDEHPVRDLDADEGLLGHPELAHEVTDFCHRWQVGLKNLRDDARGTEERLSATVDEYEHIDTEIAEDLMKLLGDFDA